MGTVGLKSVQTPKGGGSNLTSRAKKLKISIFPDFEIRKNKKTKQLEL